MSSNGGAAILGIAVIGGAIALALGSKKGASTLAPGGGSTRPSAGGRPLPWPPTPTPVSDLTSENDGPAQGGHTDPNQEPPSPIYPMNPPAPSPWLANAGGGGGGVPHDRGGVSTGPDTDPDVIHD